MMLFALGLMMLATAAADIQKDEDLVTAVSYIFPNSERQPLKTVKTQVAGRVTLTQPRSGGNTTMIVHLIGLPPNTPHAFHIHEYGDTVADGCQSTGGLYNPFNYGPQDEIRHIGDLGDLFSDGYGFINDEIEDHLVSLVGPLSVIGRAFVIHQKKDDLGKGAEAAIAESLKTGNAGPRLACGGIAYAQHPPPANQD